MHAGWQSTDIVMSLDSSRWALCTVRMEVKRKERDRGHLRKELAHEKRKGEIIGE